MWKQDDQLPLLSSTGGRSSGRGSQGQQDQPPQDERHTLEGGFFGHGYHGARRIRQAKRPNTFSPTELPSAPVLSSPSDSERPIEDGDIIDFFGNKISSKQAVPYAVIVGLVLLLVCSNGGILVIRLIRITESWSRLRLWNVTLLEWMFSLDLSVLAFAGLFTFLRLLLMLFERLGAMGSNTMLTVFFACHPFELPLALLVWSALLLGLTGSVLLVHISEHGLDLVRRALVAALVLGILLVVKHCILQSFLLLYYSARKADMSEMYRYEKIVWRLERPPIRSRLKWSMSMRRFSFMSQTLRKLQKKHSFRVSLDQASKLAAQELVRSVGGQDATRLQSRQLLQHGLTGTEVQTCMRLFGVAKEARVSETEVSSSSMSDPEFVGSNEITAESLALGLKAIYKLRKDATNEVKRTRLAKSFTMSFANILLVIIFIIAVLLISEVSFESFVIPASSTLLALSFAYGQTLQAVMDSFYMVFFAKPFNAGDVIQIDGGDDMLVKRIGILTTTFTHLRGYHVYIRNSILAQSRITNWNRGSKIMISYDFGVNWDTTAQEIDILKERIRKFMKEHPLFSSGKMGMLITSNEDEGQLLNIRVQCLLIKGIKWQDGDKRRRAQNDLIMAIQKITDDLDCQIEPYPMPIRFVNNPDLTKLSETNV